MEFKKLEKSLELNFKNKELLKQAFTHRSYLNESAGAGLEHNERLEFLGDAVIELIVTEELYKKYPLKPEGDLTNWRAALVNSKMLSKVAGNLGFNEFLLLSRGEAREGGKARAYILANTFEAVLGALYLDSGYEPAHKFIKEHLLPEIVEIIEKGSYKDAKSKFQEEAQEKVSITPNYKVLKEQGPDHNKIFEVGVFLEKEMVAAGKGSSKQEAEEDAAKKALEVKNWK